MGSAWFISFIGMYELCTFIHPFATVRYLNVLITINGLSSYMNHMSHQVFWDYMDGSTMILAVNLAAAFIVETALMLGFQNGKWPCWMRMHVCRVPLIGMVWFIVAGIINMIGLTNVSPLPGTQIALGVDGGGFVLVFNLPILGMVIIAALLLTCATNLLGESSQPHLRRARSYLMAGVVSYFSGFIMWHYVESWTPCAKLPDFFKATGHAYWHVSAAYGLHVLCALAVFLRSPTCAQHGFQWCTSSLAPLRLWLFIFPIPVVDRVCPCKECMPLQRVLNVDCQSPQGAECQVSDLPGI